jgi:hypothetical protein
MAGQQHQSLSRRRVPKTQRAILGGRGEPSPVAGERAAPHRALVAAEQLARCRIPKAKCAVTGGRGELRSVEGKGAVPDKV